MSDQCDGAGSCSVNSGDPCPGTECNTCQEDADSCFDPEGTPCGDVDGNLCTTAGCDGAGTCDQAHVLIPVSTPCSDADGDLCTEAGCDGLGTCDQLHVVVGCPPPGDLECDFGQTCNPGTGLCESNVVPPSTPCTDTDANVCTDAGCDGAGSCDQTHVLSPDSTPCPDSDPDDCMAAGCDGAGNCSDSHMFEPEGASCEDMDGDTCTFPGCDGAGACEQAYSVVPCPDTDGIDCTIPACDESGCDEAMALALGCVGEDCGGGAPRISYGGKFRRVDIHGVPMPDRSPTGEGEDDRLRNMAYIDMFSLAPRYSVSDVALPVEGGELTLEFRRTSGIRSFRHSTNTSKQGITYPSDFILGLGWDTNLNSRAIVANSSCQTDPSPPVTVRVTDSTTRTVSPSR